MASVAQPAPKQKKEAVSIREKWRNRTNYTAERFSGFAPISYAMVAEVGRLTSGKATQILYVILTAALGQIVKAKEPFNERMAALRTVELAELANCDVRTVERELGDLARRNVILWEPQPKKGVNNCTPLFRHWASLPDYKPGPVEEPEVSEETEPDSEDKAKEKTVTKVTAKPVFVGAGKRSKVLPVECGVAEIQFSADIDATWSAVVKGGRLLVSLEQKWESGVSGVPKKDLLQPNGLSTKMRQGCRGSESETGSEAAKAKGEVKAKVSTGHPRAGELSALFDPFLLKSCHKSLSGDPSALQAACEAIGDTPHDFLVKAAVERAARPISNCRTVAVICREIAHNWQKVKDLPPEKRLPTHEEIAAMIERDKANLAEANRKIIEEGKKYRKGRVA